MGVFICYFNWLCIKDSSELAKWPINFLSLEEGASKDPCSDMYCGPKAFSEVEVKGVADFIMKNSKMMKGFIDFHSFSQLWMSPWGYTTKLPPDFKDQVRFQRLNRPFYKVICCQGKKRFYFKRKGLSIALFSKKQTRD